jgi:cell division protein FtsB
MPSDPAPTSTPRRCWRWGARLFFAVAVAGAVAYLPYQAQGGTAARRLVEMRADLDRTREAIRELRVANLELRRDIAALKGDPRAIEDIARDDLGMVYPGELVIRVEPGAAR